jgi:hypothetical protein
MTIYVTAADRDRLALLRYRGQVAETNVVGLAIERLFAEYTDEQIVETLRARRLGLRRGKGIG